MTVNLVGRSLGPYQLIERLDYASPYTAFRAIDTRLFNQPVAVTVFAMPPGDEAFPRFERAAEALIELRHPHILPVQDFGEQDGFVYIGSPYLESVTLAAFIGEGQTVRREEALRLIALLSDALDHAHRQGLAHGGVTPGSIHLTSLPPGRDTLYAAWPLLGNFGLAGIADHSIGAHPAVAPYRPPEHGLAGSNPMQADLYALAAVLVTMLTGEPPEQQEDRVTAVSLSPGVGTVLQRALALNPRERFGSGAEFVLALQDAIAVDERGTDTAAAELLAEARAAVTTGKFRMAIQVYDAYLRLRPNDELIRRELAMVEGHRLERARRRQPATVSAAPAVATAPVAVEPSHTPAAPDGSPDLRPILPDRSSHDTGDGDDAARRAASRWNPFRRLNRAKPPGAATGELPGGARPATPTVTATPPARVAPHGAGRPTTEAARPEASPAQAAAGSVPALKPLVAPAHDRQRLVLPSVIGAVALIILVTLAGIGLARRDGTTNAMLTPSAGIPVGRTVSSGLSPDGASAGSPGTQRAQATNVPVVIPVAPTSAPATVPPISTMPPLPPVYEDTFFNAASGFPTQLEGQEGSGYQNGEYAIIVPNPDGLVVAELGGKEPFGDLVLEVDARVVGPSAGGSYGLVFHRQFSGNSYQQYFVLIDPEAGTVRLVKWIGTERTDLVPPTPHEAIKKGEATNRLVIVAKGGQFTILVNGTQVAQANDTSGPPNGTIALRADAGSGPIQVRFGNLVIRPAR